MSNFKDSLKWVKIYLATIKTQYRAKYERLSCNGNLTLDFKHKGATVFKYRRKLIARMILKCLKGSEIVEIGRLMRSGKNSYVINS